MVGNLDTTITRRRRRRTHLPAHPILIVMYASIGVDRYEGCYVALLLLWRFVAIVCPSPVHSLSLHDPGDSVS